MDETNQVVPKGENNSKMVLQNKACETFIVNEKDIFTIQIDFI